MSSNNEVELETPPFAMVSKFIFDYIKDANALKLYIGLYTWTDQKKFCYPTFKQIEDRIGMSKNTITKSIKKLQDAGILEVRQGEKNGNLKANYIYKLSTNLPQKKKNKSIPKNGTRESSIPNSDPSPIPKNGTALSQELGYNDNQLIDNHLLNNQEGDKSPAPVSKKELFFEDLTKDQFKRKGKTDPDLVKRFVGAEIKKFSEKNPNKYPREFLEYFYNNFTYINEHENKSKASEHLAKRGIPSIGQTLPNWFSRWKPQVNGSVDSNKCFAEKDFDFKRQNLMNNLAWVEEIKNRQNLEIYEGNQVGKIN